MFKFTKGDLLYINEHKRMRNMIATKLKLSTDYMIPFMCDSAKYTLKELYLIFHNPTKYYSTKTLEKLKNNFLGFAPPKESPDIRTKEFKQFFNEDNLHMSKIESYGKLN